MKLAPSIVIACGLVAGGLVVAVVIGATVHPAPLRPVPSDPSFPPRERVVAGGLTLEVPLTLPRDCRTAYLRVAPPLMTARTALKALLTGARASTVADDLRRAYVVLSRRETTAAVLECGSQDIATATAYRKAGDAVQAADLAAHLVGIRLAPAAVASFETQLTAVELALAAA